MSLPSGTPRDGVTVVGATVVAPYNLFRNALSFQNTSDTEMRLREDGLEATATTGFKVLPNIEVDVDTNNLISVYCAVAGKTFAATEQ